MLTCITCSKQRREDDGGEEAPVAIKDAAVKSLTTQIKDMALKVSGTHKGKPEGILKKGQGQYPEFDSKSASVPYSYVSLSSTPAWDFPTTGHHRATRADPRFTAFGGDRTPGGLESISARSGDVVLEDEDGPKEWTAQVEPGVHISFVSLPRGGNDLKRIRFSRDMFDKWQAQRWWGENYDRIMELYNVQRFNQQVPSTPGRSEDGRDSTYSRLGSVRDNHKGWAPPEKHNEVGSSGNEAANVMEASRMTTSSSVSMSNASDIESEWIEEDEPGVYITIRQLADGTRELRRVRFSREKFGEVHAKLWWETNRDRIQSQYLC